MPFPLPYPEGEGAGGLGVGPGTTVLFRPPGSHDTILSGKGWAERGLLSLALSALHSTYIHQCQGTGKNAMRTIFSFRRLGDVVWPKYTLKPNDTQNEILLVLAECSPVPVMFREIALGAGYRTLEERNAARVALKELIDEGWVRFVYLDASDNDWPVIAYMLEADVKHDGLDYHIDFIMRNYEFYDGGWRS